MPARQARTGAPWSRRQLTGLVVSVVAGIVLVLVGVVLAVLGPGAGAGAGAGASGGGAAGSGGPATTRPTGAVAEAGRDVQARRDEVANRPMPTLPGASASPGPISTRDPGQIVLPECAQAGPAGVAAGCPHTAAGAMAQLAALDKAAMESGTMTGVREVIAAWAMPGGPTTQSWSGVQVMARMLSASGQAQSGRMTVAVTPVMGLFKGSVGEDYVVACIDFEVDVTLDRTGRVAAADCQRMVWAGDRWMIGPGQEPAPAPNVWPDTDAAIDVGYRDLRWQR